MFLSRNVLASLCSHNSSREFRRVLHLTCTSNHEANESARAAEKPAGDQNAANQQTVDFGFQPVSPNEKAAKVHRVFEAVASSYDLMNDLMSAGVHRIWKDYFVSRIAPIRPGARILDVAGGTGDIAFRMAQRIQSQRMKQQPQQMAGGMTADRDKAEPLSSSIVISDINQAMLDVGKERAKVLNFDEGLLSWLCADAQRLPLENDSFSVYTIAFGIRNVVDISKALSEAYRVLKPGGRFMCLEFSHVKNPAIKWAYDNYSFQVIPPMGELVAGDWQSYQYLVESIRKFPNQDRFKAMIEDAGFRCVTYQNLTFGVVAIHSGYKI